MVGLTLFSIINARPTSVGKCKPAHSGANTQNVVVDGEHALLGGGGAVLEGDGNLGIVDAGEVASAGWLVLLWLESEGVGVDTGVGVAGVVVEWLDLVEVLAGLLGEAVLAVEDKAEVSQRTGLNSDGTVTILSHQALIGICADSTAASVCHGSAKVVEQGIVVGVGEENEIGCNVDVCAVGGEIPHGVEVGTGWSSCDGTWVTGVGVCPDELLDWVIVRQANSCALVTGSGNSLEDGIGTSVLDLLNQVLVTLLGEAAALLGIQVHVVGPHLECGALVEEALVVRSQVEVQANLVVLESNQRQVQAWVTVEEEQKGKEDANIASVGSSWCCVGGHLVPLELVLVAQEQLTVQTPPSLVVLVNTLASDGQLNISNCALSNPVGIASGVGRGLCQIKSSTWNGGQGNVHVTDQVTVTSNGHGHTTTIGSGAVHGLGDVLHRKVGVALVNSLEEGHFGLTSQIHILSTVGNELH